MSQHLTLQERNQIATLITEKGLNMNAVELARLKNLLDIWEHVKDGDGGTVQGITNLPEPVTRGYSGMKVFFGAEADTPRGTTNIVADKDTVLDSALPHLRLELFFRKNQNVGTGYTIWVRLPPEAHYIPPPTDGSARSGAHIVYWQYGQQVDLDNVITLNLNDKQLVAYNGDGNAFNLLQIPCLTDDANNPQSAHIELPPFVASLVDGQYLLDIKVNIAFEGAVFHIGYTYLSGYTDVEQTEEAINAHSA